MNDIHRNSNSAVAAIAPAAVSPWFDTKSAAAYLGSTYGTLKTWRARGTGPRYHVLASRMVRYHRDDLDTFVTSNIQEN